METIKVIDLLKELTEYEINIKNKRMRYYDKNNDCYNECALRERDIMYRLYNGNIRFNDEVETIEDTPEECKAPAKDFLDNQFKGLYPKEEKKIEKLIVYDDAINWCCNGKAINDTEKDIIDKLNEIIDYLNNKEGE